MTIKSSHYTIAPPPPSRLRTAVDGRIDHCLGVINMYAHNCPVNCPRQFLEVDQAIISLMICRWPTQGEIKHAFEWPWGGPIGLAQAGACINMARRPKTDYWGPNVLKENTAFWSILRGGIRVQAWYTAVCLECAFGRLGVMTTQASWLVQVGRGVLIGQRSCRLMTSARESVESARARSDTWHSHWAAAGSVGEQ